MISRNMAEGLGECLAALLNQTLQDFEIVLVDDRSRDGTKERVESLKDPRIRYFRNEKALGYGATRNISLQPARGKYVFFTDADCLPAKDWLERGVAIYQAKRCIGVTGHTLPLRDSSKRSERRVVSFDGRFMTCNLSFTREILEALGGFDPAFDVGQEDVEFGLRAKREGEIAYAPKMVVYHRVEPYTLRRLFTDARRYKTQVMIFKRYPADEYHKRHSPPIVKGVFLKPEDWWIIFCPFLLLRSPANQSWHDFWLIPFVFLATLYRRLVIWATALRERILLI